MVAEAIAPGVESSDYKRTMCRKFMRDSAIIDVLLLQGTVFCIM